MAASTTASQLPRQQCPPKRKDLAVNRPALPSPTPFGTGRWIMPHRLSTIDAWGHWPLRRQSSSGFGGGSGGGFLSMAADHNRRDPSHHVRRHLRVHTAAVVVVGVSPQGQGAFAAEGLAKKKIPRGVRSAAAIVCGCVVRCFTVCCPRREREMTHYRSSPSWPTSRTDEGCKSKLVLLSLLAPKNPVIHRCRLQQELKKDLARCC
jgi:hypothetical protein